MKNKIPTLIVLVIVYILLKNYIPYGNIITYPINLLVTFMHEFGHALFALITGGDVKGLVVNSDGSGVTTTAGGIRNLVVAGGYLGSAIFGNLLLYIGFKNKPTPSPSLVRRGINLSEGVIYFLSALMIFVAIFWYNGIVSSLIILSLSGVLFALARYTKYDSLILQFLGISSIIFIVEDFNIGPSSDLKAFSGILPEAVWMYVWLIIVILITVYNLRLIFKK